MRKVLSLILVLMMCISLLPATFAAEAEEVTSAKTGRSLYSDEMIENAVYNSSTYAWSRVEKHNYITMADKALELGLDFLWNSLASQDLPRSAGAAHVQGSPEWKYSCPFCGDLFDKHGQYPFTVDIFNNPWKISCKECAADFPTNDFESFYELGRISVDEATAKYPANGGKFNRSTALEKHREMLIEKGLLSSEAIALASPGEDGSDTWKLYYGYGVEGGYLYNEIHRNIYPKDDPSAAFEGGKPVNLSETETVDGWMVDDGWGYYTGRIDPNKTPEMYCPMAFYNHLANWYEVGIDASIAHKLLNALGNAYIFSGAENGGEEAKKYAVAAAVIIDRIADLYPELDIGYYYEEYGRKYGNCDGGSFCGGMVGRIWEATLIGEIAEVYDMIFPIYDDPEVVEYLNGKAQEWGLENEKSTPDEIRQNIYDGFFRQGFESYKTCKARGNFGHHQSGITKLALVFDTFPDTQEMIDWLYAPAEVDSNAREEATGGDLNNVLVGTIRRDGMNYESSVYHDYGISHILEVGEDFARYAAIKRAAGEENPVEQFSLFEHPKYLQMVTSHQRQYLLRHGTKPVGDSDKALQYGGYPDINALKKVYYYTKDTTDPDIKKKNIMIGQHIYLRKQVNNNVSLRYDSFKTNPEGLAEDLAELIAEYGEYNYDKSSILTGFGLGIIKSGTLYDEGETDGLLDTQRDFTLNFSGQWGHSHHDYLDLGMEAYGTGLITDLGYPEVASVTHGNTVQWIQATASHNTVMVNEKNQNRTHFTQIPLHFDAKDTKVKVLDAAAPDAYDECDDYRRTIVMVDYDDEVSYGVDFFRVNGGTDHNYMFMPTSDTQPEVSDNIKDKFVTQDGGTYAGPDVPFGDDPNFVVDPYGELKYPRGYTWMYDVDKAENTGENAFWFDYQITDFRGYSRNEDIDIRLRVTAVNDFAAEEISLLSVPPQRESVNSKIDHLEKAMIRRKSDVALDSLFTTVYEPYLEGSKYIESVASENVVGAPDDKVMKVTAVDGTPGADDVAKAVRVEINDIAKGVKRTDYIVYTTNKNVTYEVEDVQKGYKFKFRGFVGVWTLNDESKPIYSYVNDGEFISDEKVTTNSNRDSAVEGTVLDFQRELSLNNWVKVKFDRALTSDEANGLCDRMINIDLENAIGERAYPGNSAFMIDAVEWDEETPDEATLSFGSFSLISSFVNEKDESQGYVYDAAVGDSFEVAMSYEETYNPIREAEKPSVGDEKFETLEEAIGAAKNSDALVTIPAKTDENVASVNIAKDNVENATETKGFEIKTDFGDVIFDSDALANIGTSATEKGAETVTVKVEELTTETAGSVTTVQNLVARGIKVYDITLSTDDGTSLGNEFSKDGQGVATVKLPINGVANPTVYYIDETGAKTRLETTVDGEYIVFETTHFSTYSVEGIESIFGGLLLITNMNRITQNETEYSPIQICTGIDSLKYEKVGFIIKGDRTNAESHQIEKETSTVYSAFTVTRPDGTTKRYTPSDLGANYMYGNRVLFPSLTWTNDNTTIYITPFAVDLNGKEIFGTTTKVNEEILSANGKHLFK